MSAGNAPFAIEIERAAERDIKDLPSEVGRAILHEIQTRLSAEPYKEVKTRIKRLGGFSPTLYRLRIGDYRAYYRIAQRRVVVLAVLHKKDSERWLKRHT